MEDVETVVTNHNAERQPVGRHDRSVSWDPSVEAVPLARGWDAEPCIVDWSGTGQSALLVSSAGGSPGRSARLYRPLERAGRGLAPVLRRGNVLAGARRPAVPLPACPMIAPEPL